MVHVALSFFSMLGISLFIHVTILNAHLRTMLFYLLFYRLDIVVFDWGLGWFGWCLRPDIGLDRLCIS